MRLNLGLCLDIGRSFLLRWKGLDMAEVGARVLTGVIWGGIGPLLALQSLKFWVESGRREKVPYLEHGQRIVLVDFLALDRHRISLINWLFLSLCCLLMIFSKILTLLRLYAIWLNGLVKERKLHKNQRNH